MGILPRYNHDVVADPLAYPIHISWHPDYTQAWAEAKRFREAWVSYNLYLRLD